MSKTDAFTMLITLKERAKKIQDYLKTCPLPASGRLREAMLYSLDAGGKKIRPVLCISWALAAGCAEADVLPFAAAIEMIHTYSLIHDDLPAMDNDDLRRGKASCHKAFDEATAILAGDGLLTDAFWLALSTPRPAEQVIQATRELAYASGSGGMAGGQMEDMILTGKNSASLDEIANMQAKKTGALLQASCVCGAILGNSSPQLLTQARNYGAALGLAFQIMDDILDVIGDREIMGKPVGSDEESKKLTWPALMGIEASKIKAMEQAELAKNALINLESPERQFLWELAGFVIDRST